MAQRNRFYITTAIAYPNGAPHIGHAYEAIATDAIARFHRWLGEDVRFTTGTDEHGLKMEQTGRKHGISAREMADRMAPLFRAMDDRFNISYDDFIRTSEPRHYASVQELWRRMAANGDIYLDRYEGWYSVRDEAYYDESEIRTADDGTKLSPQGTPVEWTVEESFFFRLSKYQQPLLDYYEAHPEFIRPESRRNEVISFVKSGLRDLSVSRTSFDWGIPVPDAPGHVMYVWVDALTNYITSAGFPDDASEQFRKFWPADMHVIGKDIVRFHAVYWPAFLLSAGVPLPRQVFAHGFLFNRGEKMSKSVGNVIDPMGLADLYGVDPVRYFFLREVSFGQDGSYSHEAIVTRANAELANSFGNLAQRTLSFIVKNLEGRLPQVGEAGQPADAALLAEVRAEGAELERRFLDCDLSGGIEAWMRGVFACNQYIDHQAPWALKKTDPARMEAVLATLLAAIRQLAILILPVVPDSAAKVLDQLGVAADARDRAALDDTEWYARLTASGFTLAAPTPVFPRLSLPPEEEVAS
ncbi:methionine--tRNA ligase [Parapedomonas caeni]